MSEQNTQMDAEVQRLVEKMKNCPVTKQELSADTCVVVRDESKTARIVMSQEGWKSLRRTNFDLMAELADKHFAVDKSTVHV